MTTHRFPAPAHTPDRGLPGTIRSCPSRSDPGPAGRPPTTGDPFAEPVAATALIEAGVGLGSGSSMNRYPVRRPTGKSAAAEARAVKGSPVDLVVTGHASIGSPDGDSLPARQPALPRRLGTLGLGLLRALAAAAAVTGIALIAVISAELAHDLCARTRPGPAADRLQAANARKPPRFPPKSAAPRTRTR